MTADFANVYEDGTRAQAYAGLDFPGTYSLAFRDLPQILRHHAPGMDALDFGCGTGRSTRFLKSLDFRVRGVDIAQSMLAQARQRDPKGEYCLVPDDDLHDLPPGSYDLVLAAFTFDNVPGMDKKVRLFQALRGSLKPRGRIVTIVSAPEIYTNEWASFSTRDFPENRVARSGDRVRIVMLDVPDRRPVEDILVTDEDYRDVYQGAELTVLETHRPLASPTEPCRWVSETTIPPWTIYVLGRAIGDPSRRPADQNV
jgi:SAM-dependent methyltransferase